MILAGDLGGTKANLGLFDVKAGRLVRVADRRYVTQQHSGLEEITSDFLNGAGAKITAASFGIAGPVVNNRVQATNFPWVVDGASVASASAPESRAFGERRGSGGLRHRRAGTERTGNATRRSALAALDANRDRGRHGSGRRNSVLGRPPARAHGHRSGPRRFCSEHATAGGLVEISEYAPGMRQRGNDFVRGRISARA